MRLSGICPKSWHEYEWFFPSSQWGSSLETFPLLFLRRIASNMPFHMQREASGATQRLDSATGKSRALAPRNSRQTSLPCRHFCAHHQPKHLWVANLLRQVNAEKQANLISLITNSILFFGQAEKELFKNIGLVFKVSKWFYFNLLSLCDIRTNW